MAATALAAEVVDIREELAELQTRIERVVQEARHLPGGDHLVPQDRGLPGPPLRPRHGRRRGPRWLAPGDRGVLRGGARHRVDPPAARRGALGASLGPFFVRWRGWPSARSSRHVGALWRLCGERRLSATESGPAGRRAPARIASPPGLPLEWSVAAPARMHAIDVGGVVTEQGQPALDVSHRPRPALCKNSESRPLIRARAAW